MESVTMNVRLRTQEAQAKAKDLFDPRQAKELAQAVARMNVEMKRFVENASKIREMTKAMEALSSVMSNLPSAGGGGGSGGVGGGGGGPGGGGEAPKGPGFLRRRAGAIGATLLERIPSMGSLGAVAGALLPIGGLVGAAGMAAASTYQSRLAYEDARLASAPFLSPGIAGFQPRLNPAVPGSLLPVSPQAIDDILAPTRYRYTGSAGGQHFSAPVGPGPADRAYARGRAAVQGRLGLSDLQLSMAESFPGVGGSADSAYWAASGWRRTPGRAAYYSKPFDEGAFRSVGQQYGLDPAQALTQAAGMAQAAGIVVNPETFNAGMALQTRYGTSLSTSGGLVRGLNRGAGVADQDSMPAAIAALIGQAVARGLEGSSLNEYLEQTAGLLEEAANRGQVISTGSLTGTENALYATLGSGFRSSQIANQFTNAMYGAGFNGAGGAANYALMRASGWDPGSGMEGYAEARLRLQQGADSTQTLARYLSSVNPGGGPATQALFVQQAMSRIGVTVGAGEARALAGGLRSGLTDDERMEELTKTLTSFDTASRLVDSLAGNRKEESRIEGERVDIGGQMAGSMQKFERIVNDLAGSFANSVNPGVEAFAGAVETVTKAVVRFSQIMTVYDSPWAPPRSTGNR